MQDPARGLARRLKDARVRAGLSQRDVAERLSISQANYARWEKKRMVSLEYFAPLSRILGVSVAWLLDIDTGLTADEDRLVTIYRNASETERAAILGTVEVIAGQKGPM